MDHAGRQRPVFLPRDPVGKLQQQPVAHRHAGDDDLRGLREAEQVLVDQQGRIDGLGLGKGNAEPLGQFLGGPMLATRDQLVELLGIDAEQLRRIGRLADLADGEAGVAADRDERFDVVQRQRILQRAQHRRNLVAEHLGRLLGRVLVVGQHLVQPHGTQPQALRGDDLAVAEQRQQRAAAADVGDQRLAAGDARRVAQGLPHRRDRQPAFFRRADDLDLQARGKVDAIEKGVGIAGLAGGAGGDGPELLDLVEFQDFVEVAEDGQGHAHAGGAQASAAKGVLPQAGCPLQALDDFDLAVGQDLGDDHPHGVGADVDGRDRFGPFRFVFFFAGFHGRWLAALDRSRVAGIRIPEFPYCSETHVLG